VNKKMFGCVVAAILVFASCEMEPSGGGPTEDITSPSVTSVSPADGEDSISVVPTISVTFSEPVQESGAENAFSLSDGSDDVPGTCGWSGNTMIFTPDVELEDFTTYYVEVLSGLVVDGAGNIMTNTFTCSFATGADTNPPRIAGSDPEHQSIDIPPGVRIEVEFSEGMDTTSVEQAFTLSSGGSPLAGTFNWSYDTMYFYPSNKLTDLNTYSVALTTSAKDDSGNPMEAEFNFSFTVGVVVDIAAGNRHTIVALSGGTVKGWGQNNCGQLGSNPADYRNYPIVVNDVSEVTAVAAGRNHSVALLSDGTIKAWGSNYDGQLGNGSNSGSDTPVSVSGISTAVAIDAGVSSDLTSGGNHTVALLSNGTVKTWGDNTYGQLGNDSTTDSNIPVTVDGITNAIAVAAGGFHTVALLSDGTIMAWGKNNYGQLGNSSNADSDTPVTVTGIDNAVAIAAGGRHTLAVLDDGTVKAWGFDLYGELGDDFPKVDKNAPVSVDGIVDADGVAAGASHSAAVLSDNTINAWGSNSDFQIGSGGYADSYPTPVSVSGISTAVKVSGGRYHTVCLLSDGTVKAWGDNNYGELGDGSYDTSNVPVTVTGL